MGYVKEYSVYLYLQSTAMVQLCIHTVPLYFQGAGMKYICILSVCLYLEGAGMMYCIYVYMVSVYDYQLVESCVA